MDEQKPWCTRPPVLMAKLSRSGCVGKMSPLVLCAGPSLGSMALKYAHAPGTGTLSLTPEVYLQVHTETHIEELFIKLQESITGRWVSDLVAEMQQDTNACSHSREWRLLSL